MLVVVVVVTVSMGIAPKTLDDGVTCDKHASPYPSEYWGGYKTRAWATTCHKWFVTCAYPSIFMLVLIMTSMVAHICFTLHHLCHLKRQGPRIHVWELYRIMQMLNIKKSSMENTVLQSERISKTQKSYKKTSNMNDWKLYASEKK